MEIPKRRQICIRDSLSILTVIPGPTVLGGHIQCNELAIGESQLECIMGM